MLNLTSKSVCFMLSDTYGSLLSTTINNETPSQMDNSMKFFAIKALLGGLLMAVSSLAVGQNASPIDGVWLQDDGSTTVRIAPCGSQNIHCGTVIAEKRASNQPSNLNKIMAKNFRATSDNSWKGKMIDGEKSFDGTAVMAGPNKLKFKVCVLAFLCKSFNFNRAR
jgi:uncharacterized protein (DUF2147 family)